MQKSGDPSVFQEDQTVYENGNGVVLWGIPCSESNYWKLVRTDKGNRICGDVSRQLSYSFLTFV